MGTPFPELARQGCVDAGGRRARHNLWKVCFAFQKSGEGVSATAGFSVPAGTLVKSSTAKLERLTNCGSGDDAAPRPEWVRSAVELCPTVSVSEDGADDAVDIRALLDSSFVDDSKRQKRQRKAQSLVKIIVPITRSARQASDVEHVWQCNGHPDSGWCNVATLEATVILVAKKTAAKLPVTLRGSVGMPLSQPYCRVFVPQGFPYLLEGLTEATGALRRWDPRKRFSIVNLSDVRGLLEDESSLRHFVGRALIRSAVLMYEHLGGGGRVLFIPHDVCALLPSLPATVVGAADAFAIMKLVTTMPLAFVVRDDDRLDSTRRGEAMVSFDAAQSHSLFTCERLRRIYGVDVPRVGIKPADNVPPDRWDKRDWWCAAPFARSIYKAYSMLHKD